MAKHGGFSGMNPGNMSNMLKQAQKMQQQMQEQARELEEKEFSATAGGGAVNVVVSGKKEIKSLTIDKDAVDPDDVEMLQDMIMAAVNEALRKVEAETAGMMGKLNGLL